MINFININN